MSALTRRRPVLFLIAWCLLSVWLLYGGLELAEELQLLVKMQPCAQDLDMQALLQLASGLKSDVPALENRLALVGTAEAVASASLIPAHTIDWEDHQTIQALPSLRLHQRLSIYRM